MMQKLITIYLDNSKYSDKKPNDKHGFVEEHIKDYLSEGWHITSITSFGGGGGSYNNVNGWLAVLLEKQNNKE